MIQSRETTGQMFRFRFGFSCHELKWEVTVLIRAQRILGIATQRDATKGEKDNFDLVESEGNPECRKQWGFQREGCKINHEK